MESLQEDYAVFDSEGLLDSLVATLLLGHPGRSGPFPSFLALPWIENREEGIPDN
jgi:hypothetical protein